MKKFSKISLCLIFGLGLGAFSCKKEEPKPKPGPIVFDVPVKDIDNNEYQTIKIGDQIWMAENLRTTRLNDNTFISYASDPSDWANVNLANSMYCYYDGQAENVTKYGILYNGYAVQTGKLAPLGWHVATEADWQTLLDYLISNGYNFDGSYSGNKVAKALASKDGWDVLGEIEPGLPSYEPEKNNSSGFAAFPGGFRANNGQYYDGGQGVMWHANSDGVFRTGLSPISSELRIKNDINVMRYGFYVRCVKNAP